MNCYECAIHGEDTAAVATCRHCGVGMCLEHFRAELDYESHGIRYTCKHDLSARPAVTVAAEADGRTHRWLHAAR